MSTQGSTVEMETEEILDMEFIEKKVSEYREESDENTGTTRTVTSVSEEPLLETDTTTTLDTEYEFGEVGKDYKMTLSESYDLTNTDSERLLRSIVYEAECSPSEEVGLETTETLGLDEVVDETSFHEDESYFSPTLIPEFPERKIELILEEGTMKMRFRTDSDETIMSSVFKVTSTIADIKERLGTLFKMDTSIIELTYNGDVCDDMVQPAYLTDDSTSVMLGIRSNRTEWLAPGEFFSYSPNVHIMTVQVLRDVGVYEVISISVENQAFIKEWLGGYRNRRTKLEYHHAWIQTLPRKRVTEFPLVSRDTQTPVFPLKDTDDDTTVSKATQMWRPDHYIPAVSDRIVATCPCRFRPVPKMRLEILFPVVVRVKRVAKRFVSERKARLEAAKQARIDKNSEAAAAARRNAQLQGNEKLIVGSTFPVNREDFYLLYLLIGNWWRNENKRIKDIKTGAARKAALLQLLNNEIDLMAVIEQHRINAKQEVLSKQDMHFVETCARPVIFCNEKGIMSSIDTLETQQARELMEIVSSYLNTNVTIEARIDVLCTLKCLVGSYGSPECGQEIIELLERECDLLVIGLTGDQLHGLRKRVFQLIMYMLHIKTVNPACKYAKRPCTPKTDKRHYLCHYCRKLKQTCDYNVHVKLTAFHMCMSCEWMKNIGQERADITPFARILAQVRESEMIKCCYSSVCYVLQPVGMTYLVTRIWHCKSILSDQSDLNRLRMTRFRQNEDWSPWNCILLTVDECVTHAAIEDVEQFYGSFTLEMIHWRHLRAKNHFLPLLLNDRFMRETKLWFNVQDTGVFLHPSHINKFAQQEDFEYIG